MIKIDKTKFDLTQMEDLYANEIRYAEGQGKKKSLTLVGKVAFEMDRFMEEWKTAGGANPTIGQRIAHRFLLQTSLVDSLGKADAGKIREYLFSEEPEESIRTFWKCVSHVWTKELCTNGVINSSEVTDRHGTKLSQWSFGEEFQIPQKFPSDELVKMVSNVITDDNIVLFEGISRAVLKKVQSFVPGKDAQALVDSIKNTDKCDLRDIRFRFQTSLTVPAAKGSAAGTAPKKAFPDDVIGILSKIFRYEWLDGKPRHDVLTAMHVEVCPYCNRQYISAYDDGEKQTTADLDHYYCKAKHPYLALSLYNFIPSCQICNSRFKISRDFFANEHVYPYRRGFGSDAVFVITNLMALIDLTKANDGKLFALENVSGEEAIQRSMDTFHLDAIYQAHSDYVKELIKKSHEYLACADFLLASFPQLFASKDDILTSFFGICLKPEEQHKRPLAKLTQDILMDLNVL